MEAVQVEGGHACMFMYTESWRIEVQGAIHDRTVIYVQPAYFYT